MIFFAVFLLWNRKGSFSKRGSTLFFILFLIFILVGAYFGYRYFFPDDQKSFNRAIIGGNAGDCSRIDDSFLQRSCLYFISNRSNSTEERSLFTDPFFRSFESVQRTLVYSNGTQIPCERIDDAGLREACLSRKGMDTRCSDSCRAWLSYFDAIKKEDSSSCGSLPEVPISSGGVSLQEACLSFFAGHDAPSAELIERNEKYYRDAIYSLNPGDCEKITIPSFQKDCQNDVSLRLSVSEDQK